MGSTTSTNHTHPQPSMILTHSSISLCSLVNFDYNCTPISSPGTCIVAHTSANSCTSFGPDRQIGWYIRPSSENYRCYKCYFLDTMPKTNVLKVTFFPEKLPFPNVTDSNCLCQTANNLLHLLQTKPAQQHPNQRQFGPPVYNAFQEVATILDCSIAA